MEEDKLRKAGGLLCTGYGAVILCVGAYLANYDIRRGHIVWSTFSVVVPAVVIFLAGLGALFRKRIWPAAALAGSTMILALSWKAANGSIALFLIPPIGLITLIVPVLIFLMSLRALAINRVTK